MYCENRDEQVDYEDCISCRDRYDCDDKITKKSLTEKEKEKIDHSELAKAMQEKLSVLLGVSPEEVDKIAFGIVASAERSVRDNIQNCLTKMLEAKVSMSIAEMVGKYLNAAFKSAIEEEILCWDKDEKVIKQKIQEIVLGRINRFLAAKDRNNRQVIQQTVDKAIETKVDEMVAETLEEIKTETIDKFNREITKKMMTGMATAIANDKRLLAVIGE